MDIIFIVMLVIVSIQAIQTKKDLENEKKKADWWKDRYLKGINNG